MHIFFLSRTFDGQCLARFLLIIMVLSVLVRDDSLTCLRHINIKSHGDGFKVFDDKKTVLVVDKTFTRYMNQA